ncbi:MAG: hypothetical protein KJO00_01485 [Bacteroidia bacterium]|nr:hypothetical protein [Bacteroidia bacterium]MBT8286659.1 hypothetical protein [Bacteroidia bacterium]NNK72443.1 hypothetical protein [Flavobacteriaceae bacterium]
MLTVLLFIPVAMGAPELIILYALFISIFAFFDVGLKLSGKALNAIFPLVIIFFEGLIISLFYKNSMYDFAKDLFFFLKPILFIFLGYYLVTRIKDKDFIFKLIINLALLFALWHILTILTYVWDNPFNINKIRFFGGKANYIELMALILLLIRNRQILTGITIKRVRLVKMIILISCILYFSRTMIIGFILLYFSYIGYFKISKKGVSYIFSFITLVGMLYLVLSFIDIDRDSTGIIGFLYKIKIAPSEIFTTDIDLDTHSFLWDHWRGYEAAKAFEQLGDTPYNVGFVFGKGFGALVDLGFLAPLSETGEQFIPTLHNGYAYIIFKTGFFGLFFFLLFLIYVYFQAYSKSGVLRVRAISNLIGGIALFYAFTALIIGGIYNHGDIITVLLGAMFALKHFFVFKLYKST